MELFTNTNLPVSSLPDGPYTAPDGPYTAPDDVVEKNKPQKVLTDDQRVVFESVFFVFICGLIGLCGTVANVINIIIFSKQGFVNTVNIAFIGLAVSDLWYVLLLVWTSICMNPLLPLYGIPWESIEVMYVSAAWPGNCFCRTTSHITVYITAERWLSIAFPLKVKRFVTKTRTAIIISLIYFVNIVSIIPECATTYLGWSFLPERNKTLIAAIFTSSRKHIEGVCFVIHSMLSLAGFIGVVLFTIALVIKLTQSSQMRSELTSSGEDHKGSMSARDKKAVKLIVLIASILIACYIPGATIAMTAFVVGPEFNIQGRYINICASVWSIACSCQTINSSVNIFLYYRMSSKYRSTFDELFSLTRKNKTALE